MKDKGAILRMTYNYINRQFSKSLFSIFAKSLSTRGLLAHVPGEGRHLRGDDGGRLAGRLPHFEREGASTKQVRDAPSESQIDTSLLT